MIHRRAWAMLVMTAVGLSMMLPTVAATHEVPGPDPVDIHDGAPVPIPDGPSDTPQVGHGSWAEDVQTCVDKVLATFLAAVAGMDVVGWLHPDEPYCDDQGDQLEATVGEVEGEITDLAP